MNDVDQIIEIQPDVKWIGAYDPDIVTFDIVMETQNGTTYNSYFINAAKKTVVETVKEKFGKIYIEKLKTLCKLEELAYIIVNHTEPDHVGTVKMLLDVAPNAVVVGSGNALRYLRDIVGHDFKSQQVKDGDELDLGDRKIQFIGAPNLHWPDSMYSYLPNEKILFTCDSFGAHYCDERMFDDLVDFYDESFKYYFDVILKPFSKFMLKAIEKIRPLEIKVICPGHGPILRSDWKRYVDLSEQYSKEYLAETNCAKQKLLIAYVSAYGFTGELAAAIAEGAKESGDVEVILLDVEKIHPNDLSEQLTNATSLLVGSPTINQNTLLPIYTLFALCNPIRDRGKMAGAFGSYGWSGEACDIIVASLKALKFNVAEESLKVKFRPAAEALAQARAFGKSFAEKAKASLQTAE
ncbi:MAG: FprA family A-type flavoprotein [Bacteroidota bacterium]